MGERKVLAVFRQIRSHGYSLLEVVTITTLVGILASLAVPAYQDYSIRTKVAAGISLASVLQERVAYFYTVNGDLPTQNSDLEISPTGTEYATDTIKSAAISNDGVITIAFKDLGAKATDGQTLKFIPTIANGSVSWDCDAKTGGGSLPDEYTPIVCRGVD